MNGEKKSKKKIDPSDDEFGLILNCAVRYSIGRQTYMPHSVIDFITPLLPYVSGRTLGVLERDVADAAWYGHEIIDKPHWMKFLADIRNEMERRKGNERKGGQNNGI